MVLRATVTGALVNVCANFALIPVLKQDGAAIASVLSELAVTAILLFYARKYYTLRLGRHYLLTLAGALAVMTAVVVVMKRVLGTGRPWMVLIVIVAAALSYFVVLTLLRNEVVLEFWKKLGSRVKR